jgi:hypothetical protein
MRSYTSSQTDKIDDNYHPNKKIKSNSSNNNNDDLIANNYEQGNDDISILSDSTPPNLPDERQPTADEINNGVLGKLLNTLFAVPDTKQLKFRDQSKRFSYNNPSLRIKSNPNSDNILRSSECDEANYHYIVDRVHSSVAYINSLDLKSCESIINDIFMHDCSMKTVALPVPRVGRHHILEMWRSLLRCCNYLNIFITHHDRCTLNGSTVLIFHHLSEGE